MSPLDLIADWPVDQAAAAMVGADGHRHTFGDIDQVFALASVTKLMTAMAVLVAHEEGTLDLDTPTPGADATTADLLAHSAGLSPDRREQIAPPRTRRIYSTAGYELVADLVADAAQMPFPDYLHEAVLAPLEMSKSALSGSAGADGRSSVRDLLRLAAAWRTPTLIDATTLQRATSPHHPDLSGVLPGYGRQTPNPWGLGPELRGRKAPHWTAPGNAPRTFGHFGRSGTMLWIDPVAETTLIVLTDREFGPWATNRWPELASAALAG